MVTMSCGRRVSGLGNVQPRLSDVLLRIHYRVPPAARPLRRGDFSAVCASSSLMATGPIAEYYNICLTSTPLEHRPEVISTKAPRKTRHRAGVGLDRSARSGGAPCEHRALKSWGQRTEPRGVSGLSTLAGSQVRALYRWSDEEAIGLGARSARCIGAHPAYLERMLYVNGRVVRASPQGLTSRRDDLCGLTTELPGDNAQGAAHRPAMAEGTAGRGMVPGDFASPKRPSVTVKARV